MVSSAVRIKSCSGSGLAALKRPRFASERSEKGRNEVIRVRSESIEASCW